MIDASINQILILVNSLNFIRTCMSTPSTLSVKKYYFGDIKHAHSIPYQRKNIEQLWEKT